MRLLLGKVPQQRRQQQRLQQLRQTGCCFHVAAGSTNVTTSIPSEASLYSFDTYKFVQRLEADGFSRDQAETVMNSLCEVVRESLTSISSTSISKADFEKNMYMNSVELNHLRNEVQLLRANDMALLKADASRLQAQVTRVRQRAAEELRRVQSNVRIDLGREKGRLRDEKSAQEIRLKELDARIESETGTIGMMLEGTPGDLFKTLFPIFSAAGALVFSYLRFIR